jgi:hypothetical protein
MVSNHCISLSKGFSLAEVEFNRILTFLICRLVRRASTDLEGGLPYYAVACADTA